MSPLHRKMENAQAISSLVLSLRAKEKIKVRQPLQKIMIPIDSEEQKEEILAVADLIKHEVNIKEVELLEDASDILVKQIKPNALCPFQTFGLLGSVCFRRARNVGFDWCTDGLIVDQRSQD